MIEPEETYTTGEAAKILRLTSRRVTQLLERGGLSQMPPQIWVAGVATWVGWFVLGDLRGLRRVGRTCGDGVVGEAENV